MKILRNLAVMAVLVYGQSAFSMRPGFSNALKNVSSIAGESSGNNFRETLNSKSWILDYCKDLLKRWDNFITQYPMESWSPDENKEVVECLKKMSETPFLYLNWKSALLELENELKVLKAADEKVQPLILKINEIASIK